MSRYVDGRRPALLWILAIGSLLNGIWMFLLPRSWFDWMPGAAGTGPYNDHFVRDVGSAYLAVGAALALAAREPRAAFLLMIVVCSFMGLHALIHVQDVWSGHGHLPIDLLGVITPAAICIALAAWVRGDRR